MAQRRSPFGYSGMSDGAMTGASPTTAMPTTGTGTDDTNMYGTELEQVPGAPPAESPATLRRRLMPIAGNVDGGMGALDFVQQLINKRGGQ